MKKTCLLSKDRYAQSALKMILREKKLKRKEIKELKMNMK